MCYNTGGLTPHIHMQTKVSPLLASGILGLLAGGIATIVVTTLTVTTLAVTTASIAALTVGSSGTAIDLVKIQSSTINVSSIGAGSGTSSAVAFTGAALGDNVSVGLTGNWAAPSSSVIVTGSVTAADVVTIYFKNTSSTAVDLTSAAYSVIVTSP